MVVLGRRPGGGILLTDMRSIISPDIKNVLVVKNYPVKGRIILQDIEPVWPLCICPKLCVGFVGYSVFDPLVSGAINKIFVEMRMC